MMSKIKIFHEGNSGPDVVQEKINDFLLEVDLVDIKPVIETVEGIAYLTLIVIYNERE